MVRRTAIIIVFSLFSWTTVIFAGSQDERVNELVNQLNGKTCQFEIKGNTCVNRSFFASVMRRNDKYFCIIDSAKALGMMGSQAKAAVPDLIEALNKYRNVDTGDGILPVRSEIVLALGQIGDPSAIRMLISILGTEDSVTLPESASVPEGTKLAQGTSYMTIVKALTMFGPQAKEALPALNELLVQKRKKLTDYERGLIEEAIREISE